MPCPSASPIGAPSSPRRLAPPIVLAAALVLGAVAPGLLLAPSARAQTAPTRVTARVWADSVSVGERFRITLTAEHAPGLLAAFPDPGAGTLTVGDVELVRRLPASGVPGGTVDSVTYEAAAFAVGTAVVPPLRVRFTTAGEDTFSAATDTLRIPVRSVVPPEADELRDLAPLVGFARPWWHWALLALAVLAVLGALVWAWRRWRRRGGALAEAPPRSPYEEAVERLRALEAADPAAPDPKPYYVELSDALRTYLARRLGVAAREETTAELVRDLRRHAGRPDVPEDLAARVGDVLAVADLAKYADARPAPDEGRAALRKARAAVDAVEAAAAAAAAERPDGEDGDGSSRVPPSAAPSDRPSVSTAP